MRWFNLNLFCSVFFLWVSPVMASQDIANVTSAPGQRVSNDEVGVSLAIPAGWKKASVYQQAAFVLIEPPTEAGDSFSENVSMVLDVFSAPLTLDQYFQVSQDAIQQALKQVAIQQTGETLLGGQRVKWLRYSHVMKVGELVALQYYVVKGGKGYVLTYTSRLEDFARYRELFEENAKTLVIK